MDQEKLMKTAFVVSMVSMLIGSALKFMHIGGAAIFFTVMLLAAVTWAALALVEVYSSKRLHITEKIMWTVGFIVFNMLAGLLYFLTGRQHVIGRKSLFQIDIEH